MKNVNVFLIVAGMIILLACEKSNDSKLVEITGTYVGTLSKQNLSKSRTDLSSSEATTIVSSIGDQIEVYCFGDLIDTTLIFDYYYHNDSVFVCHTGEEFKNLYGHMKGQGHMSGGMMGDMHGSETEWMHHLSDEHEENDEHFGNFNTQDNSFNYLFKMSDGDYQFQGSK